MKNKLLQSNLLNSVWISPTSITLLIMVIIVSLSVMINDGDPLALTRIGTQYLNGDPDGTEGYDGQFIYYIALDPNPISVAEHLDVPAYRYQRILMPLLTRLFAFGNATLIPWILVLIGIVSQTIGTRTVEKLFQRWGINHWYALLYGLYAGFLLAIVVDLPEPLAYALVVLGVLAIDSERRLLGWVLLALAVFTKEVTILFAGAIIVSDFLKGRWSSIIGMLSVVIVPYMLFQVWLWSTFGQLGIGSGGNMATSFEWIPFMGLIRIGESSWIYLLGMLIVFGPTLLWAAIWGIWKPMNVLRIGDHNMLVFGLLFNSLMILFLPFSTYRETGGLLRLACGLVVSVLLFAAYYRERRILNYCRFWLVLNVFLLK